MKSNFQKYKRIRVAMDTNIVRKVKYPKRRSHKHTKKCDSKRGRLRNKETVSDIIHKLMHLSQFEREPKLVLNESMLVDELPFRYVHINVISSGASGIVYKCLDKEINEYVALKIQPLTFIGVNEVEALRELKHKNIVQYHAHWLQIINGKIRLAMTMEYADDLTLLDFSQAQGYLPNTDARAIFHQIISAVEYAHISGWCHRDLKVENILLTHKLTKVLLADWGYAGKTNRPSTQGLGSMHYAAPELHLSQHYDGRLVDIWALGIILYAMLTGRLPFDHKNTDIISNMVISEEPDYSRIRDASAIDLISGLLRKTPSERYNFGKIRSHPWYVDNSGIPEILPRAAQIDSREPRRTTPSRQRLSSSDTPRRTVPLQIKSRREQNSNKLRSKIRQTIGKTGGSKSSIGSVRPKDVELDNLKNKKGSSIIV